MPRLRLFLLLSVTCLLGFPATAFSSIRPFVTRQGDRLMEGDTPFRFVGLVAPNIHQNETGLSPDFSNRWPDEFEIRDQLASLRHQGARVTRCFSLSVRSGKDAGIPVAITGLRAYNEDAFRTLDLILALCPEYDLRLILPLLDGHAYEGWQGLNAFAAFRNKQGRDFWTDEELKADFRHLLTFLTQRRNTVNGLLYKDDPSLLAWQLGQELNLHAPENNLDWNEYSVKRLTAWSVEMAAELRRLDPNHLIMEAGGDRAVYLQDPNIDVLSTHLNEYWNRQFNQLWDFGPIVRGERTASEGKKPLVIDDFGMASLDNVRGLLTAVRETGVSGALLWSLRGHRRDGGFYYKVEEGTVYQSYHVPGFATGQAFDEIQILDLLRREAYAVRGLPVPPVPPPAPAPRLIQLGASASLTWRGSAGASCYRLERALSPDGPWLCLQAGLQDSALPDPKAYSSSKDQRPFALYVDETLPAATKAYYRLKAFNSSGETPWSDILELRSEGFPSGQAR